MFYHPVLLILPNRRIIEALLPARVVERALEGKPLRMEEIRITIDPKYGIPRGTRLAISDILVRV